MNNPAEPGITLLWDRLSSHKTGLEGLIYVSDESVNHLHQQINSDFNGVEDQYAFFAKEVRDWFDDHGADYNFIYKCYGITDQLWLRTSPAMVSLFVLRWKHVWASNIEFRID